MNRRLSFFWVVTVLTAACASSTTRGDAPEAPVTVDGGSDAGTTDAGQGTDGTSDAGHDAAEAAQDAPTELPDGSDGNETGPDSTADDAAAIDASPQGVPMLAVGTITGATSAELVMIADGVTLANDTMKTICFRDFILSASWTETNGLTQAEIYEKLCSGIITVNVDMYLGSFYENHVSKTIGYEAEPGTVHMNRYFVDTSYMVADNLIHEGEGHSQGFTHYGVKATSVPYGLNDAFEACSPVGP